MRQYLKNLPVIGVVIKSTMSLLRALKDRKNNALLYYRNKEFIKPSGALKNLNLNKRCFILATGPSINKQDLKALSRECCISVSNFFVHPDFTVIHPEYHLFAGSHDPIKDEQMVAWLRSAEKHFPVGQKVLLSIIDKYLVDDFNLFKKQKVYYYHLGMGGMNTDKDISFTGTVPGIGGVALIATSFGLYIGSNEIYLLGVDHDYLLHVGESKHFYKEHENELVKKGYVEGIAKQGERDLENDLVATISTWKGYKKLREYAKKRGVQIWNSTPVSTLDMFPKKSLENVLHESH